MDKINHMLSQMTLEEKVSLLAGANFWETVPIERLGIPSLKVTDGPNGARGSIFKDGVKSACFPVGIALAATWNTILVEEIGQALADEVKAKGAQVLLAPTVNIHRSPLNGRNFECYSEDPYLGARMAVAYITGLQSKGVGATIKHFVCNDSEFERQSISTEVSERPLHEIYLPAFKAATQEAKSWCLMSSYNRINGTYASENAYTLTDILRTDWDFKGMVVSDWTGTQSTAESVNAGQDLEMPGPAEWRGEKLLQAVKAGKVSEAAINTSARRVLELLEKAGKFEHPQSQPEQAINRLEHGALIRKAGSEAAVLLKNKNHALPLDKSMIKSIALIGPNAKVARIQGGGSAGVNPHYLVTPFEGVTAKLGKDTSVGYELGCSLHKLLPVLDADQLTADGLDIQFFNNSDLSGKPAVTQKASRGEFHWIGQVVEGVNPMKFSGRIQGTLKPTENGIYTFSLLGMVKCRLLLEGKEIIDNWKDFHSYFIFMGLDHAEPMARLELIAGKEYRLEVEFTKPDDPRPFAALRIGLLPPIPADCIQRAASLAKKSDAAVVFAGFSDEWESEGFDRPNMDLAGQQNELIEKVAAANPNTIVVLNIGSPINMPWLDKVAAVLVAWYPGQECGNAIADVLFGDVNPSGRLPQTFPLRLEDNPAYINYPGENGKVYYGEGLYVGYRYYDKKKVEVLFPFGYGLSYTTFGYGSLKLSADEIGPSDHLSISVDITNSGKTAGKEVVQLYIHDVESKLHRPEKELKGFTKVELKPGETKTVSFKIGREALAYFDDLERMWVAEAGEFELRLGASSQDIRTTAKFTLTETVKYHD
jgi:beta-glucosidase